MRAHIITNGVITNTIEVNALDALGDLYELVDASIGGSIGDSIVDGVVVPKAPDPIPVPSSVTMRQARLALRLAGLLGAVNTAVAAAGEAAAIEWEFSGEVHRTHGLVPQLSAALGLTDAQLDALFVSAAAL